MAWILSDREFCSHFNSPGSRNQYLHSLEHGLQPNSAGELMPLNQNQTIDASPTKDFFISMLIKDIGTSRAILDLVDNSVDGARLLRPGGNYNGLKVEIEANKE